jgi:hypothetical protein
MPSAVGSPKSDVSCQLSFVRLPNQGDGLRARTREESAIPNLNSFCRELSQTFFGRSLSCAFALRGLISFDQGFLASILANPVFEHPALWIQAHVRIDPIASDGEYTGEWPGRENGRPGFQ